MHTKCSYEGCTKPLYAVTTGYCRQHHQQLKKSGVLTPLRGELKECEHPGCHSRAQSKGFCRVHYMQFWKYGVTYGDGSPVCCKVVNCQRPVSASGYCQRHFAKGPQSELLGSNTPCTVGRCDKTGYAGVCRSHKERARKFGLSIDQFKELMLQDSCEVCGKTGVSLDIHHDHGCCDFAGSCGKCVVAILCGPCNRAAGAAGDDPDRLRKLADVISRGPRF